MYEPARVGIFERIEEATLTEVCDLLRSSRKYLLYVANVFFGIELTEQCIKPEKSLSLINKYPLNTDQTSTETKLFIYQSHDFVFQNAVTILYYTAAVISL